MAHALRLALATWVTFALAPSAVADDAPGVVASIGPVHSLVAGVMEGVGVPHLVVKGGGSPHTYGMRPSDARALARAGVVFWIGAGFETFLEVPLSALARGARTVALAEANGLTLLPFREGGPWEQRDPDSETGRAGHIGHADGTIDMHLWLDPLNAKTMVETIVNTLAAADPANEAIYRANADRLEIRLDALSAELAAELAPIRSKPFVVFHDAFRYFETRFSLNAVGSVTTSSERRPGVRRVFDIRAKITRLGAVCVFAEPQFRSGLVDVVTEGTAAKTGTLDPIGAALAAGPELYFALMRSNARALTRCLDENG
ncbi:MAG: zinc ABC transporter substrate-binding protein [Rhodospirillales bacterium]|jgi:zinc transport system substrate-binding protein|nr:zinc ABC transporter substrate-binding protein [Rhodospirillales bacterium]